MFKDNFITVCRAHHLALKSERTYWSAASQYINWLGAKSAKDVEIHRVSKDQYGEPGSEIGFVSFYSGPNQFRQFRS